MRTLHVDKLTRSTVYESNDIEVEKLRPTVCEADFTNNVTHEQDYGVSICCRRLTICMSTVPGLHAVAFHSIEANEFFFGMHIPLRHSFA